MNSFPSELPFSFCSNQTSEMKDGSLRPVLHCLPSSICVAGGASKCSRCDVGVVKNEPKISNSSPDATLLEKDSTSSNEVDSEQEDEVSEGGDDFHCTQIVESSQDSDDENLPLHERLSSLEVPQIESKPQTESMIPKQPKRQKAHNDPDVCFICGASLSKLMRRIDHIKRCSKKHGITGRDVRTMDIGCEYVTSPTAAETKDSSSEKPESAWHGDADRLLKLTNQDNSAKRLFPSPKGPSPTTWAASGYDSKSGRFVPPTEDVAAAPRNVNAVLMAGSRRLEVLAKATDKRNEIRQSGARKRPRFPASRNGNWGCPMYKKITGTDFVVDGFHYASPMLTKNYFLTHFHSDHYGGIASSWKDGTIYCSLATASLVSQQLKVDKKFLHPLPMNTPTVIESRGKPITVILLDANHCPGACMFLFEIGRRKILHVGDFRWSREVMLRDESSPLAKIASQESTLDELYLDTTYCNEKYQLPKQSDTIEAIIRKFKEETETSRKGGNQNRTLHLFGAYTIGKEKMFLAVAKEFQQRVYVDKARHKILSAVNMPEDCLKVLTTNKDMADIWVVPMGHLNMKKMPEYFRMSNSKPFGRGYDRVVGYRPTGWSLSRSGIVSTRTSGKLTIHSVPYSEHSSFPELVDCLACLRPAKIVPTVGASKSDEQVKILMQGLRNKQNAMKLFSRKSKDVRCRV